MSVITQGRKQYIVPLDILFGWKSYKKKYPESKIMKFCDRNELEVAGPERYDIIKGRKWSRD